MQSIDPEQSRKAIEERLDAHKKKREELRVDALRYSTVLHEPRRTLKLSLNEYVIADSIYRLSGSKSPVPGWCVMEPEKLGATLDLGQATIYRAIKVLKDKKLIQSQPRTKYLRTTTEWYNEVERLNENRKAS